MTFSKSKLTVAARLALLTALQVVLSRFASIETLELKLGFSFVPEMFAGALYGIPGGALVCGLSDLLGALLFPSGPFFPGYTVTAVLRGVIFGAFFYHKRNRRKLLVTLGVYTLICVVITLFLNTLNIAVQYGYILPLQKGTADITLANIPKKFIALLPTRVTEAVVMVPIETVVTAALLNKYRVDLRLLKTWW